MIGIVVLCGDWVGGLIPGGGRGFCIWHEVWLILWIVAGVSVRPGFILKM